MTTKRKILTGGAAVVALVVAGGGAALATGAFDTEDAGPDVPIEGPALDRASQAAIDHLGEGRVTDTEVGDEESYYEIEVTLDDGRQVDVQLDESFQVVGSSADAEEPGDAD